MTTDATRTLGAAFEHINTRRTEAGERLNRLCESAFHAEHHHQFERAHQLHTQAIEGLNKLLNNAGFDRDRKRAAKKQIKFHTARQQLIRPLKDGEQTTLPLILPTSVSGQEELLAVENGPLPISLEEHWLGKHLEDKASNPGLAPGPRVQHLFQSPVPFYTPTLDPAFPDVTYNIYLKPDGSSQQKYLYYYNVKLATDGDSQTLYVLKIPKRLRQQIPITTFHRSSELMNACIETTITPVVTGLTEHSAYKKGRPMEFSTSSSYIEEQPDQLESNSWGPRRFTYGGRQFVWISEKDESHPQTLYEVEKTWPKPDSKKGEKDHKLVGRKLAWGESKTFPWNKWHVLHMAGGMDQLFREYILASQLTRLAVIIYSHR